MNDRAVALMSGSELLSAYDDLHDQIEERKARQAEILHRLDEIGYAAELGAHDTARLITHRYRLDAAEAHRRVNFATRLHKYPAVAAALASHHDGVALHMAQAEAIVTALEKIPAKANVPPEDLAQAELRMVEAAEHVSPFDLCKLGVQVRDLLDTDGPEPREDAARQREEVWIKKTDDGIKFGGFFAAENAETLETVLQSGAKPHKTETGEQDPRSRGKRQADALIDALNISLRTADLPGHGGIKPHITVTIDLKDLIEAGQHATGDLAFGHGLSAGAVRRLACDAGIIPVVLGSDSQVLDVGREYRFVTTALRNALNYRDRGCVICNAPPVYCDAHHLTSWADGGATSLANTVLLCRVDHTSLHQGHWTITIEDNQVQVSRPTWADRSPGRHRKPAPPSPTIPAPTAAMDTPTCPPQAEPTANATCSPTTEAAANATSPSPPTSSTQPPSPAPNRRWPHTNDTTWITPEEAATYDPWPDEDPATDTNTGTNTGMVSSTDISTSTGPRTGTETRSGTDGTGTGVGTRTPATPARPRPYLSEVSWITPEEAAAIDPWPDTA